jgi:hypothetical protein
METVNAVQALVNAGEVDAANCCALLDKHEGMHFLESVMNKKMGLIEKRQMEQMKREVEAEMANVEYEEVYAMSKGDEGKVQQAKKKRTKLQKKLNLADEHGTKTDSGLHIICSSIIYDDLFRQVRLWARMGYTGIAIQKELDLRFSEIIQQSLSVRDTVAEVAESVDVSGGGGGGSGSGSGGGGGGGGGGGSGSGSGSGDAVGVKKAAMEIMAEADELELAEIEALDLLSSETKDDTDTKF